jgi:hypothetical protein
MGLECWRWKDVRGGKRSTIARRKTTTTRRRLSMGHDRLTLAEYAERVGTPYRTLYGRLRTAIRRGLDRELVTDDRNKLRRQYIYRWDDWLAPKPMGRPKGVRHD